MKPVLRLSTTNGTRPISRRAAAGMLRAARILQHRDTRYSLTFGRRVGIVRGEGPTGDWQLEHARGAA
ncbi:hypothetical protein [Variovorax sp. RCC_210]|uniref:hypothetical protein n=1 Tax=Variovorax sp. RCC_210 TaxID=3239217 RepID=UPI0035236A00